MNWAGIESTFQSERTLTLMTMGGLPTKDRAVGSRPEMTLMGVPFGKRVAVSRAVDGTLLDYYREVGLAPAEVHLLPENRSPEAALLSEPIENVEQLAGLCPSEESRAFVASRGGSHAFAEVDEQVFRRVLGRDFLLLPSEEVGALPAISLSQARTMGADAAWYHLNHFGQGLWMRDCYSVHGDAIQPLPRIQDLDLALQEGGESKLLVPHVPRSEVLYDLELAFSVENGRTELLGVVEQIIERNRHVGSRDVTLSPELQSRIEGAVAKLGERLAKEGFHRGIFGLDAFVLKDGQRFLPYDLNPCISQAFFPLYLKQRVERLYGPARHFQVHLYATFPEVTFAEVQATGSLIRPGSSYGMVPILFTSSRSQGTAFGRATLMALFLADSRHDLKERVEKFEKALSAPRRKIYRMHF